MKNVTSILKLSFKLYLVLFSFSVLAQDIASKKNDLIITPRVGYDILPIYDNRAPYVDYEGGLNLGASVDYYFNFIGIGADFDYIKNTAINQYPTENIFQADGVALTDLMLSENDITRMFWGIGPNFRYLTKNRKFSAEVNTRVGLSNIKGGTVSLSDLKTGLLLNYHSGYDVKNVLAAKGQIRFTYYFSENLGFTLGSYYLRHFGATELDEFGFASSHQPFSTIQGDEGTSINVLGRNSEPVIENIRDTDISSIGAFAGISYRFGKSNKEKNVCPVCNLDHKPHCTIPENCTVAIVAKDKFSKERIPNADIAVTDENGKIIKSGKTNVYGAVIFDDVPSGNYTVTGNGYGVELEAATITIEDFKACKDGNKPIEKEILYGDENFILEGEIIECNSIVNISNANVLLRDTNTSTQKNTISDEEGKFNFQLKQVSIYTLKGNKDGYFSHEVEVNTKDYDRSKSLFIDFQMCVDPCGKAIRLNNINFNLGKWDILPMAFSELEYVIELMNDNPEIKVEMSSHTDSRGSNEFNQKLSQKRAQATVDYLVSKGIAKDRLIAVGLGETKPLNICRDYINCSEEQYAVNRRTEFKVICPSEE